MAFLTIDKTQCKQDGICAAECPRRIIIQKDDQSYPEIPKGYEAYCLACGHCVAVCPHGALSVSGVAIEDCPEIKEDLVLSWGQAEQFLLLSYFYRGMEKNAGSERSAIPMVRVVISAETALFPFMPGLSYASMLRSISRAWITRINWVMTIKIINALKKSQVMTA